MMHFEAHLVGVRAVPQRQRLPRLEVGGEEPLELGGRPRPLVGEQHLLQLQPPALRVAPGALHGSRCRGARRTEKTPLFTEISF